VLYNFFEHAKQPIFQVRQVLPSNI